MWTESNYEKEIEDNAKKAIEILFEAHDELHYFKLSYY